MPLMEPWGSHPRPVALLGWPVAQSISPAIHNAAFAEAGVPGHYLALAVPPEQLPDALRGLVALGFVGANVTVPHKEAVLPLLDEVSPEAARIGAVNVIAVREGRLVGANTDAAGFLAHLQRLGIDPAGMRAVILGAGGAARAVAYALAKAGVRELTVLNRTPARADAVAALARDVAREEGRDLPVRIGPLSGPDCRIILSQAHLLVNCTPLGMGPHPAETPLPEGLGALPPGAVVYDTVYRPEPTWLIREAQKMALVAVDGLGMLVHQAALSWAVWFGQPGPLAAMEAAAHRALAASRTAGTAADPAASAPGQ
ncbi:MAG: shikimate dehydrogenase [Firmicutes bacterium]|nr:shikimate dehydrogenase [Bacillota bacterium]